MTPEDSKQQVAAIKKELCKECTRPLPEYKSEFCSKGCCQAYTFDCIIRH